MTAAEIIHKFDVFRNSDVRTDRGRPLPNAYRTFCHASGINFLQQPVHACPGSLLLLENFLNQRTLWAPVLLLA